MNTDTDFVTQNQRRESLINTWERAFLVNLKTKRQFKKRLNELQTWDIMNNEFERNCKIQALNRLLGK